jgi:hypothetical protein
MEWVKCNEEECTWQGLEEQLEDEQYCPECGCGDIEEVDLDLPPVPAIDLRGLIKEDLLLAKIKAIQHSDSTSAWKVAMITSEVRKFHQAFPAFPTDIISELTIQAV